MRWKVGVLVLLGIGQMARPAVAVMALSVYGGTSLTMNSDFRLCQPGGTDLIFHNAAWSSHNAFTPPPIDLGAPYYGIQLTYFPSSCARWGYGLDYFHFRAFTNPARTLHVTGVQNGVPVNDLEPMDNAIQLFNMTHGVNFLTLFAERRWNPGPVSSAFPLGRLQPYVGIGGGEMVPM